MWGGHSCPPTLTYWFLVRSLGEIVKSNIKNKGNRKDKGKCGGQECPPHTFVIRLLF